MKKEVMLQFPSLRAVYLFCAAIRLDIFELNCRTLLLTFHCRPEDLDLALIHFGAKRIDQLEARISHERP